MSVYTIRREMDLTIVGWFQGVLFGDCPIFKGTDADWWTAWGPGGCPVAFAGISLMSPQGPYLCRAGVLPVARGKGLQARLIRIRLKAAKERGVSSVVTDTASWNIPSINNLIDAGFRAFDPITPWGTEGAIHWRKEI